MSDALQFKVVDGIKCFSPDVAESYSDYPSCGFELTDDKSETSFWVQSRNRLLKYLVHRHLSSKGKTKLLEIGCGTGGFIQQIVGTEGLDITGSEIYTQGLVYAKQKLPEVNFVQFDVTSGTMDETYDIILAFDVIEHIADDAAALSNISRMLREGATLIVTVPQYMFLWSSLDDIVRHKRRYSKAELLEKLRRHGFDIVYCTSYVFFLFPLMLISRLIDRRRDQSQTDEQALEKRVTFPKALNWVLGLVMRMDETLIRLGISLPFGGTLLVVASAASRK